MTMFAICLCVVCSAVVIEVLSLGVTDQRNLGTSLRPERATLDQVRARLKLHKEKQEVKKDEGNLVRGKERESGRESMFRTPWQSLRCI